MSFLFPSWPTAFSPEFHESAKATLEAALNKGNKPPVIQGRIEVVELHMGKEPPTLTLLEIGDLSLDRFRGILRLGYQGDAWLEVRCRVQANPLSHNPNINSTVLPLSTPLLASQPLLVPMTLRLSKLHLRAILILVVSASKGITLVFKNDPLQNVDVSSTFDSVEVIRGYLQQEIEGQLREMFREDLPGIIHRLSQRWLTGSGVGGKVEMPYRDDPSSQAQPDEWEEPPFPSPHTPSGIPAAPQNTPMSISPRKRTASALRRASNAFSESPTSYTTFPDIEDYDPTYGLRPEGVPTHSGYEAFGRLWEKNREGGGRGLGSLMGLGKVDEDRGEVDDWDDPDMDSLDMVELSDALQPGNLSASTSGGFEEDLVEWETYPAVGGGTITRPRVFHAQSQIRIPSEAGGAAPSPGGTATAGSVTARASSVGGASSTVGSLRLTQAPLAGPSQYRPSMNRPASLRRMVTSRSDVFLSQTRPASAAGIPGSGSYGSLYEKSQAPQRRSTNASSHTRSSWDTDRATTRTTNPTSIGAQDSSAGPPPATVHSRSPSNATNLTGSFPPRSSGSNILLNNTVSQLASLSHSAHTLSPYARAHEHIAVRSFPHLGRSSTLGNVTATSADAIKAGAVKAHRKRIYAVSKGDSSPGPIDKSQTAPTTPSLYSHQPLRSQPTSPKAMSADLPVPRTPFSWKSASLTGLASRVMNDRPAIARGDSRTSYGFPPSAHGDTSSYREHS